MNTQIGQKKKKEAVRRLSQNAARRQSLENKRVRIQGTGLKNIAFGKTKRLSSQIESPVSVNSDFSNASKKVKESESNFGRSADSLSSFPQFGSSPVSSATPIPTTSSFGFPVKTSVPLFDPTASGLPVSSLNQAPIFGSASTTSSGFPVPSVVQPTTGFPLSANQTSLFGSKSTASSGFPVPSVIKSTTGFPVLSPANQTSIFNTKSTTSSGFPVSSDSPTSSGFPVSSPQKFSFLVGSDNSTENKPSIGFPVNPIDSKPKSSVNFGFGVSHTDSTIEKKTPLTSVGFPITPVSSSKTLSIFGSGANTAEEDLSQPQKQPLQPSQPIGKRPNVFGKMVNSNKQGVNVSPEEKVIIADISNLKSLIIREIPEAYNKNAWLKRFYSRFGEVVKVQCNSLKSSATVVFKTHEAAKLAKVKGRIFQKGLNPVNIFWRQERKRTTSDPRDLQGLARKKPKDQVIETVKEKSTTRDPHLDIQSLPIAVMAGERFKVLEMIDTKIREGLKKQSDITKAKAVKGTCPDMCPEKERYMREDRRRLHVFETIPGTGSLEENPVVDHMKAVKEYDRSAADKEEPLPNELRPIPTLNMTMDYLVTSIMDTGEGKWADWYDFLWNRTRAIRKDITQQHLCDVESVDLIEKTARFHVFCSHYLCEQDFGVFDPRINTENLTKCLQTLKHFYDDLKDQNILCPFEAEFRVYDILLNLNQGDILRQVMTYREEIRSSPLVRFAMDVFQALNSNNFVRFFRLVRSSNYLCACLLHRYFTQARQKALRILNYSLSIANKEMNYQLTHLCHMLAFEDENEAAAFCRFHELKVDEPFVVFRRGSFVEPEATFPVSRSLKLIESKRTCLIGEVVYNGPLPPKPNHIPASSFDQSGKYIASSHTVPTIPSTSPKAISPIVQEVRFQGFSQPEFKPDTKQPLPASSPPVQINIEELEAAAKSLFIEVINEMIQEITEEVSAKVQQLLHWSDEIAAEVETQGVSELLQETAEDVIIEEQKQQLLQAQQELFRNRASHSLVSDIVQEVVDEKVREVTSAIYSAEQKLVVEKSKEIASEQIGVELIQETVVEEIKWLVLSSYGEMKTQRKSCLQQIARNVLRSCERRYFYRWVRSYRSRIRLKKLLSDFPPHSPFTSVEVQLSNLIGPHYDTETSSLHTTRIFESEQNVAETLIHRQKELDRLRSEVLHPVDVPMILATTSGRTSHGVTPSSFIDWKLLVSFPEYCPKLDHSCVTLSNIHVSPSLIKEKFKRGAIAEENKIPASLSRKVELLALYSCEAPPTLPVRRSCHVCTMACYGVLANNEVTELVSTRQFQGTSAVMVVIQADQLQTYSARQELRTRLRRIVQSKPDIPAIPAAILLLENHVTRNQVTKEMIFDAIGATDLSSHLSELTLSRLSTPTDKETLDQVIQRTISWLAQRSQNQLQLESDSLKNFIESGLQRFFFSALYDDVATRKKARLGEQCPEAVVDLYNSVVHHLAAVASSSTLTRVSWPVKQFSKIKINELPIEDWNSEASLSSLNSVILSLCLPAPPPGAQDGKWESETLLCHKYARQLPQSVMLLPRRVTFILESKLRSLQNINFFSTTPRVCAAEVPWTLVIEACISSLVTSLHSDPVLSEMEVFYLEEEMHGFVQPDMWRDAALSSKQESVVEFERRARPSVPAKTRDQLIRESVSMIDEDLNKILNVNKVQAQEKRRRAASLEESCMKLKTELGTALEDARKDVASFEKQLQKLLPEYIPTQQKTVV